MVRGPLGDHRRGVRGALGAELAGAAAPIALLLLADGAACHGPKAPRAEDSRAGAYEDAVNAALAAGDPAALRALDPDLGAELSATGPLLWPLLTAAAAGQAWTGEVLHHGAPYGVGWTVALWRREDRPDLRMSRVRPTTGLMRSSLAGGATGRRNRADSGAHKPCRIAQSVWPRP